MNLNEALIKFFDAVRGKGVLEAIKKSGRYISYKRVINARRKELAIQIADMSNWHILYGPFAGMEISQSNWWGQTDLGSKILGFYEAEILEILGGIDKNKYKKFLDVGAADGYYAIGCVYAGFFEESYCYEMSVKGREVIKSNAVLNKVSEKLKIYGCADQKFLDQLIGLKLSETVVLIDIEGGEFDLLTEEILERLNQSILIVELHEFMVENGLKKLDSLSARLNKHYSVRWLTTGARDLSNINLLEEFNDTDRWLLCSEGRIKLQKWIVCEPLPEMV